VERFNLSHDPHIEEKVRDIVGLYLNPPDCALVRSLDERSQIQALDRTAPILPLRSSLPERQTHDDRRHGTTTLFATFNILKARSWAVACHRMDNYATHKSAAVQRLLKTKKRRRFHFAPTISSWCRGTFHCVRNWKRP